MARRPAYATCVLRWMLFINGQLVQSCAAVQTELGRLEQDAELHLTLMRGDELLEVTLKPREAPHP